MAAQSKGATTMTLTGRPWPTRMNFVVMRWHHGIYIFTAILRYTLHGRERTKQVRVRRR